MASTAQAGNFPALHELKLSKGTHYCIYWMPKEARYCRHKKTLDYDRAKVLREKIVIAYLAEGPSASYNRLSLIEELLIQFCCLQHITKLHPATDQGKLIRRSWKDELSSAAPVHPDVEEDEGTPPPTADQRPYISPPQPASSPPTGSRYHLRSSRHTSSSESANIHDVLSNSTSGFQPMKAPGLTVSLKLLKGPSGPRLRPTKHLYAYARDSSPGMLKIGSTCNVDERLDAWSRDCRYQPQLRHHITDVPFAQFVEGLIHAEMLPYWRREMKCKHNPDCGKQHKEWFEVDDATAFRVMDNWAKWVIVAKPYDSRDQLKPIWRTIIENMNVNGIPVTSQGLVDAIATAADDVAVPSNASIEDAPAPSAIARPVVEDVLETSVATTDLESDAVDLTDTAGMVTALADMLLSLTPAQARQLRGLLDQGTRRSAAISLPPAPRLVPAV